MNDWLAVNQFTVVENQHTAGPNRAVHQRPAARRDRTQERGRRERDDLDRLQAASDLPGARSRRCSLRTPCWSFRTGSRRASARSALGANGSSPGGRSPARGLADRAYAGNAGRHRGRVRAAAVSRPGPRLHRVRGRRRRTRRQEDGGLPPIPRGEVAVEETLRAAELQREAGGFGEEPGHYDAGRKPGGQPGDRRVGVVWHTQGSGKSLTMAFYAGRVIREPAMENPTLVVLTDRNDLDDQLFGTFSRCHELLRQPPVQAQSRTAPPRELLSVAAGGVVFTTIQKFFPEEKRRPASGAVRPAQHRRHRRRGAPQPVRLHRRLRAPHARCAAARLVHRLHRHADRA